ncbi:MAG TPA: sigma-70 family RNA polymerase sigma factor, partial [Chitinophagaceae bacterium]
MNPSSAPYLPDNEILHRYKKDGNKEWIGVLFDRYILLLLGVCMKYLKNEEDAKDSVQQVFLKVLDELQKHEIVYFKAWIYRVTKNYCLMQLRNPRGKKIISLNENTLQVEEKPAGMEEDIARDRLLENMQTALQQLNEEQRTCIRMFYLQKKSYQEIERITGYTL